MKERREAGAVLLVAAFISVLAHLWVWAIFGIPDDIGFAWGWSEGLFAVIGAVLVATTMDW